MRDYTTSKYEDYYAERFHNIAMQGLEGCDDRAGRLDRIDCRRATVILEYDDMGFIYSHVVTRAEADDMMAGAHFMERVHNLKDAYDDLKLDHIPDVAECRRLIRQFKADNYFTDVWHINERGNVDLLSIGWNGAKIVRSAV